MFNPEDMFIGGSLGRYGEFSEYEVQALLHWMPEGGVVLDVGANIGCLTVPLSRKAGTLIALEPQRVTFQHLCANVAMSGQRNVHTIHAGAGSHDGWMTVTPLAWDGPGNNGGYALAASEQGEKVRIIRIDSLGLSACHLIKIDVEGMESDVLSGATETIRKHRPVLYVEAENEAKCPELIEHIHALGYRAWWHFPPLFNENNFDRNAVNAYPDIISINLLCLPDGQDPDWEGGIEAVSGDTFLKVRERHTS
jgi:FkbM family methyltransferase